MPACCYHFGQGTDTSTVLTNKSKHITVIKEPRDQRHVSPFSSSNNKNQFYKKNDRCIRKGDRPMHITTLTFEKSPLTQSYSSTAKESFQGRKNLQPGKRPPRCPSQHSKHFELSHPSDGVNDSLRFPKVNEQRFSTIACTSSSNEHKRRLKRHMSGENMHSLLSHKHLPRDNSTTYKSTYIGSTRPRQHQNYFVEHIDVITGVLTTYPYHENFHRTSGNKVLNDVRNRSNDFLIG